MVWVLLFSICSLVAIIILYSLQEKGCVHSGSRDFSGKNAELGKPDFIFYQPCYHSQTSQPFWAVAFFLAYKQTAPNSPHMIILRLKWYYAYRNQCKTQYKCMTLFLCMECSRFLRNSRVLHCGVMKVGTVRPSMRAPGQTSFCMPHFLSVNRKNNSTSQSWCEGEM